jgi:hypothetical protein
MHFVLTSSPACVLPAELDLFFPHSPYFESICKRDKVAQRGVS